MGRAGGRGGEGGEGRGGLAGCLKLGFRGGGWGAGTRRHTVGEGKGESGARGRTWYYFFIVCGLFCVLPCVPSRTWY